MKGYTKPLKIELLVHYGRPSGLKRETQCRQSFLGIPIPLFRIPTREKQKFASANDLKIEVLIIKVIIYIYDI